MFSKKQAFLSIAAFFILITASFTALTAGESTVFGKTYAGANEAATDVSASYTATSTPGDIKVYNSIESDVNISGAFKSKPISQLKDKDKKRGKGKDKDKKKKRKRRKKDKDKDDDSKDDKSSDDDSKDDDSKDDKSSDDDSSDDETNDVNAPIIFNLSPSNGDILSNNIPLITGEYSDDLSGINTAGLIVLLDNNNVTPQVNITTTSFAYTPTSPLIDGLHILSITVSDNAGNQATETINFTISTDQTPPTISNIAPANGTTVLISQPALSAAFSDDASGINTNSVVITLDNVNITSQAAITAGGFNATPSAQLNDGIHSLTITVNDNAGNQASATIGFTTDTIAPAISNITPIDGSIVAIAQPSISGSFSDNVSGINTNTVVINLDNADITAQANVTETGFNVTPSTPLNDGIHTLTITASDNAGNQASETVNFTTSTDQSPPAISIIAPVDGSTLFTAQPALSAAFSDDVSGVDVNSVIILLDNTNITAQAIITETDFTAASPTPLNEGPHTLAVTVSDNAGNQAIETVGFTISFDADAPLIAITAPENGSTFAIIQPAISASFSDAVSGIDTNSAKVELDNIDITAQALVTASSIEIAQTEPLTDGAHSIAISVSDNAGNPATETTSFKIDTTAPSFDSVNPVEGSTVATNKPVISAAYSDALSGIDANTAKVILDNIDVTSLSTVSPASISFAPTTELANGPHTAIFEIKDLAGNIATAQTIFTVSFNPDAPILNPVGNKTVDLGSTLSFTVTGSDPSNDPITVMASPIPLPKNVSFNCGTGLFTFVPDISQAGVSFNITFIVSDGLLTNSETVTITVNPAPTTGITTLQGRIYDADDAKIGITTPIAGAVVTNLETGLSTTTDNSGNFTLAGIPSGLNHFEYNGAGVTSASGLPYGAYRGKQEIIENVANIIDRPIFIMRVAIESEAQIDPNTTTVVTNSNIGITMTVPPNTVKDESGNNYTGAISISEVPEGFTPAALPENLGPDMVVTLQPMGLTFAQPAPITFPNTTNLQPSTHVDIWSLDHSTGKFFIAGKGQVDNSGAFINTVEGGIRETSWHFPEPGPPSGGPCLTCFEEGSGGGGFGGGGGGGGCDEKAKSGFRLQTGNFFEDHTLPAYRTLGVSKALKFIYNSEAAYPAPIVSVFSSQIGNTDVPDTQSTKIVVGGVDFNNEIFTEGSDFPSRKSTIFDARNIPTGFYPYTFDLKNYWDDSFSGTTTTGNVIVNNQINSPFGAGWTLDGLQRLYDQNREDGRVLITEGNGASIVLDPTGATGRTNSDFTTIVKNNDNSFTRTTKNGIKAHFDANGLHTSTVDRNGNTTTFSYDSNSLLTTITDPVGLVTTLNYQDGLLSSVTDPAGRVTTFQHDIHGNLTKIIDPNGSESTYEYDAKRLLIKEIEPTGNEHTINYDFAGRFKSFIFADGSTKHLLPNIVKGLADVKNGVGTKNNPAPNVTTRDLDSRFINGNGIESQIFFDKFDATIEKTTLNCAKPSTTITRNDDGLPLAIRKRIGHAERTLLDVLYDANGNIFRSFKFGGRFSYTYDPIFDLVTSITAPKGTITNDPDDFITRINYDAKGNPIEVVDTLGNKTTYAFNLQGLLTSVSDALGKTTTFMYDSKGNIASTTDPLGNTTTFTTDAAGNVISLTDANGNTTNFMYNLANQLTSVIDAKGNSTNYSYDANGNMTHVIDANGNVTQFAYDAMDRIAVKTDPLGNSESFVYDGNGNLITKTDRNGQITNFEYDCEDLLVKKSQVIDPVAPVELDTTLVYDAFGSLINATDSDSNISFTYDGGFRITSASTSGSQNQPDMTINYVYDSHDNLISMTDSVSLPGSATTYSYDDLDRITDITNPSNQSVNYGYDALNRRISAGLSNGVATNFTYDAISRLTSLQHKLGAITLSGFDYTYDNLFNRTGMNTSRTGATVENSIAYIYDNIYQLTQATRPLPAQPDETFNYDSTGNRLSRDGQTLDSVVGPVNRLLADALFVYRYDKNGNLTEKIDKATSESTTYIYDFDNQLTQINMPGSRTAHYSYDSFGRRVEKDVDGAITRYVYDREDILYEFDGNNSQLARYTHGLGIDEPLIMEKNGLDFFYHTDGLGSITDLTDSNGVMAQNYVYDSFGNIDQQIGSIDNPYTYTGREFDAETGLYYYRARYYDAEVGRFITEDPIGLLGGLNIYKYVLNNPVNFVDPSGLIVVCTRLLFADVFICIDVDNVEFEGFFKIPDAPCIFNCFFDDDEFEPLMDKFKDDDDDDDTCF